MAQAEIIIADDSLLPTVVQVYNDVFRPPANVEFFRRRFRGRAHVLTLIAQIDGRPVGFKIGFELKPGMFYSWMAGVLPGYRRQGIGRQLLEAQFDWCRENGYDFVRLEVNHTNRPALHFAIAAGFVLCGVRWDSTYSDQMVLFERPIPESSESLSEDWM